jgi:hypothetical protein
MSDPSVLIADRTRAFLGAVSAEVAALRAEATQRWLGHKYDSSAKRDDVYSAATLEGLYSYAESDFSRRTSDLETSFQQVRAGKLTPESFADTCYRDVYYSLPTLVHVEFGSAVTHINFLSTEFRRLQDRLSQEYSQARDSLQSQYAAGAITFAQKEAALAALQDRQSGQMKAQFDSAAPRYRALMLRLARFRRDWVSELGSWHDWAAHMSKAANDPHAQWAGELEKAAFTLFSKQAGPTAPLNVVHFAFTPGSPDRLNTGCSSYKWCKPGLYPDIQDPESPAMFRMWNLVDVKLNDSLTEGSVDGAGPKEGP